MSGAQLQTSVRKRSVELTPREYEIIQCMISGPSTNADIANQLGIATNTIKGHMKNIFNKLDVTSRTELAIKVIEQKSVTPIGE